MRILLDRYFLYEFMTQRHAARELETPIPHKDPFDELLLAQAQEEGLKLLTTDRRIIGHPLAITV